MSDNWGPSAESRPEFCLTGLAHYTAPVVLREKLAFRSAEIPQALTALLNHVRAREGAILSTCNRVEIYAVGEPGDTDLSSRLRRFLSESQGVAEEILCVACYARRGAEGIRHLFEVAAGLDSQVLGENEVLAQVRQAYRLAVESGAAGPVLRRIFERALFLGKEIRSAGGFEGLGASAGSAAVELAEKVWGELRGRVVLVVGAGEMAGAIVRALQKAGAGEIIVASRTQEHAQDCAMQAGIRCGRLERLSEHLFESDIVLVSTAAPHYVLRPQHLQAAMAARGSRPLLVIDLSVPRNVDPEIARFPGVFLHDLDGLEEVAESGREERAEVAERWRPRLAGEARQALRALSFDAPDETAQRLLALADSLRQEALEASATREELARGEAERLARALERFQSRLLHTPLSALKEAAREGDGLSAAHWLARLFRLEPREREEPPPEKGEAGIAARSGS